jgi:hypothetical protein
MMRVGMYRPVHVKTLRSQKLRMLLTHRKLLQSNAIEHGNARIGIAAWPANPDVACYSKPGPPATIFSFSF